MIPNELKQFVDELVVKASKLGNISVSINFCDGDMSIHVYPYIPTSVETTVEADPEKVEVYDK